MKSRTLTCITAIALFAPLAIPVQEGSDNRPRHPRRTEQVCAVGMPGCWALFRANDAC